MPAQGRYELAFAKRFFWMVVLAAMLSFIPGMLRAETSSVEQMRFTFQPPLEPVALFGNAWTIFATGQIDQGAARRLKDGLAARSVPPHSIVYFDSPGGSLLEGVELGRVIRDAGLITYVGRQNPTDRIASLPGRCLSSCSLAFLGGRFRYLSRGSVYGVHRFFFRGKEVGDTTDISQVVSAVIVSYINEMGAHPGLFSLMTEAGKDEIRILRPEELKSLGVTKDETHPVWSIESTPNGDLYLKGQRETEWGIDKIFLACGDKGEVILGGIFGDRGRANLIVDMHAGSILVDGGTIKIPMERMQGPSVKNGIVNVAFLLTPSEMQKIVRAKGVGVAVQFTYEAPTFSGIYEIDLAEGRAKMSGLLSSCKANRSAR